MLLSSLLWGTTRGILGHVLTLWGGFLILSLVKFSLELLLVSVLQSLLSSFNILVSGASILLSLSLDVIKGHTDNRLLNSGLSSSSLLLDVFNSNFLVESSGSLGPSKLDWLDSLVVQRFNLC